MNTMPIFIYGVIQGSWKIGIYQILMTIMSAAIWYPFFKPLTTRLWPRKRPAQSLSSPRNKKQKQ